MNNNAPRVTDADIDAQIIREIYLVPGQLLGAGFAIETLAEPRLLSLSAMTICILVLRNGAKVLGVNYGPVDLAIFDQQMGRDEARKDARNKVWELEGYLLRTRLHEQAPVLTEADALADLAGQPRPDHPTPNFSQGV